MEKREIWAIINVEDVIRNTNVEKVMACYDFKQWEKDEIKSLSNTSNESLNEFRWKYVAETLEITNKCFSDVGYLVKDLIEDIKMGYHKVSEDLINLDIEQMDKVNSYFDEIEILNFEYKPLRDYETNNITSIEIFYMENDNISEEVKNREIEELIAALELTNIYKKSKIAC